jgi:hypothetical protein
MVCRNMLREPWHDVRREVHTSLGTDVMKDDSESDGDCNELPQQQQQRVLKRKPTIVITI